MEFIPYSESPSWKLPCCEIPTETKKVFQVDNQESYRELCEEICERIGADCWSCRIPHEVLFNRYTKDHKFKERVFKERILDELVRDALIKDLHRNLLSQIHLEGKNSFIWLYMFGSDSYKVEYRYDAAAKTYTRQTFLSEGYIEKFGKDEPV